MNLFTSNRTMFGIAMSTRRGIWLTAPHLIGGLLIATLFIGPACAQGGGPPPELTKLERQVSLKIAHVRIQGPTSAADLKQLGLAQQAQLDGEKAIKSGDYDQAEKDFLRANVLISAINE
jgi:hypothetical protein